MRKWVVSMILISSLSIRAKQKHLMLIQRQVFLILTLSAIPTGFYAPEAEFTAYLTEPSAINALTPPLA
jgi:hypothetical protein